MNADGRHPSERREGPQPLTPLERQPAEAAMATFRVAGNVWTFLAARLYSNPVMSIVMRELKQNSADACRRAGRDPRITFVIRSNPGLSYGSLSCCDNGCGMTAEVLAARFLALGATSKGLDETGGFGVGKAIILGGCTWWSVKTTDCHVTLDHINKKPIETGLPPVDGTLVELRYDPLPEHDMRCSKIKMSESAFVTGLSWLAHDAVPTHVSVVRDGFLTQIWELPGLPLDDSSIVAEGTRQHTAWKLFQAPAQQIAPLLTPGAGSLAPKSAGRLFVRLRGLVQFSTSVGDHPDCWVLDIETSAAPGDPDYPLSLSREDLEQRLRCEVDAAILPHHQNPVTSATRQFRARNAPVTEYYSGQMLLPDAPDDDDLPQMDPGESQPSESEIESDRLYRRCSAFSEQSTDIDTGRFSPAGVALMVKGADRSRRDVGAPHNVRLLRVWGKLVAAMLRGGEISESFGIGFLHDATTLAERVEGPKGIYYLVNPTASSALVSRPAATLLRLAFTAAHEAAHARYAAHTEYHSSLMAAMLDNCSEWLAEHWRELLWEIAGEQGNHHREQTDQLSLWACEKGGR